MTTLIPKFDLKDGGATPTGAVNRPINEKLSETISVKDFGAIGDGIADDTAAIKNAITALIALGGGILLFPNTTANNYYLGATATGTVSLPVPVSGINFTTTNQSLQYHFYLNNVSGISFVGAGVTLTSGVTDGGNIFIFNGCRSIEWDGINLTSVHAFTSSTGAVTVAGMNGLAFTSTTQDSNLISIRNVVFNAVGAGVYVFGDSASAYRVRGIDIVNTLHYACEYGLQFSNNGYLVTFDNVRISNCNARAYFCYGVTNHRGSIEIENPSYNNLFGLVLIKAYDSNTSNIELKVSSAQPTNGGIGQINFQSQNVPAYQPTPANITNVNINMNDAGNTGSSLVFNYITGGDTGGGAAVYETTSSYNLFNNIVISGVVQDASSISTTVIQTPAGVLNLNNLTFVTGVLGIYSGQGFLPNSNGIFNNTFNDNSSYTLGVVNNTSGSVLLRDAGGVVQIPFYAVGGDGTNAVWNVLNPITGWQYNQAGYTASFTNNGTGGGTYTINFVAGSGNLSIQRTSGAGNYEVYCETNARIT